MKQFGYKKAIFFCVIVIGLLIIPFIPLTSASIKNSEILFKPKVERNEKLTFFAYVTIDLKSGNYNFDPPILLWNSNGKITIIGIGNNYHSDGGQLAEGSLTLFMGKIADSQIQGFALISWLTIDT